MVSYLLNAIWVVMLSTLLNAMEYWPVLFSTKTRLQYRNFASVYRMLQSHQCYNSLPWISLLIQIDQVNRTTLSQMEFHCREGAMTQCYNTCLPCRKSQIQSLVGVLIQLYQSQFFGGCCFSRIYTLSIFWLFDIAESKNPKNIQEF